MPARPPVAGPLVSRPEDTYAYNEADQLTEIKMKKGTETLASLSYTRDNDGQVKSTTAKGLPGTETIEDTYDESNRLTKAGSTEFKYDAANNPITDGTSTNTFNEADELTKGPCERVPVHCVRSSVNATNRRPVRKGVTR